MSSEIGKWEVVWMTLRLEGRKGREYWSGGGAGDTE